MATPKQLKDDFDPGKWSRVSRRVQLDERVRRLSRPPPNGNTLWMHLLTNSHLTSIAGLFAAREETLAGDLGWSLEGFRKAFQEVSREGLARADWEAGLVWLPKALRHDPPSNPNVVKSWRKVAKDGLPECALLGEALRGIREELQEVLRNPTPYIAAFDETFPKAFLEGFTEAFLPPPPEVGRNHDTRHPTPDTRSKEDLSHAPAREPSSSPRPAQPMDRAPSNRPPDPPLVGQQPPAGREIQPTRPASGRDPADLLDAVAGKVPAHPKSGWRGVRGLYLAMRERLPSLADWPEGMPGNTHAQNAWDVTAQRLPMEGPRGWPGVMAAIAASPWARGEGGANPRWLMDPEKDRALELLGGSYRQSAPTPGTGPPRGATNSRRHVGASDIDPAKYRVDLPPKGN